MNIFKHTITIYSPYDSVEIDVLAKNAVDGDCICDGHEREEVAEKDLPEGVASFFNMGSEDAEGKENRLDIPYPCVDHD